MRFGAATAAAAVVIASACPAAYSAAGGADTSDAYVSRAEAQTTVAGETRHRLRVRIGPVTELYNTARSRDYTPYHYRSEVWRVRYLRGRAGGPLLVESWRWLRCDGEVCETLEAYP